MTQPVFWFDGQVLFLLEERLSGEAGNREQTDYLQSWRVIHNYIDGLRQFNRDGVYELAIFNHLSRDHFEDIDEDCTSKAVECKRPREKSFCIHSFRPQDQEIMLC